MASILIFCHDCCIILSSVFSNFSTSMLVWFVVRFLVEVGSTMVPKINHWAVIFSQRGDTRGLHPTGVGILAPTLRPATTKTNPKSHFAWFGLDACWFSISCWGVRRVLVDNIYFDLVLVPFGHLRARCLHFLRRSNPQNHSKLHRSDEWRNNETTKNTNNETTKHRNDERENDMTTHRNKRYTDDAKNDETNKRQHNEATKRGNNETTPSFGKSVLKAWRNVKWNYIKV